MKNLHSRILVQQMLLQGHEKLALSDTGAADAAAKPALSARPCSPTLELLRQHLLHRKLESASFAADSAASTSESAS